MRNVQTLEESVFTVLEGFTLPFDARKILETAYYNNQETMISIQEAWVASGGNPGIKATKDMLLFSLGLLDKVCDEADIKYDEMRKEISAKQAKIDDLMLEYCPEEMTEDQKKEWEMHQVPIRSTQWKECD